MTEIVSDIRSEAYESRKKDIKLHFVMSNVPDLDDEDQILENKIMEFQRQLNFLQEPMIVHRYDSLSLLNQVVFVKDRPRSRLASEYDKIVQEISTLNSNDRDGALEYIGRASRRWQRAGGDSIRTRENMLERIEEAHSNDGEVLFRLAEVREIDRQWEHAALLVNQAIDAGYEQPEAYLKRARVKHDNKESDGMIEYIRRVLSSEQVTPPIVREAIRLWMNQKTLETFVPEEITESTAVMSLEVDVKLWLAETFNRSRKDLMIAVSLLYQISNDLYPMLIQASLPGQGFLSPYSEFDIHELSNAVQTDNRVSYLLGLSYMGLGQCSKTARIFRLTNGLIRHNDEQALDKLDIETAFNYGMAMWGVDGTIEIDAFLRVVELDGSNIQKGTPNYLQCMTITHWAVGDRSKALDHIDQAEKAISGLRGRAEFSYWRYLRVSASEFRADLINIRDMIEGDDSLMPHFMIGTSAESPDS